MSSKSREGINNGMYRSDIDEQKIIDLYNNENMSISSIAKELKCDRGVVKRRLQKHNIAIVKKNRSDIQKDNMPAKRKLYYKYKLSAKNRNYEFKLSFEEFLKLTQQNCFYCNTQPMQEERYNSHHCYIYNGVDRFDNSKGYIMDNVVTCCKICNQMKSSMSGHDFIKQINKISNNIKGE